MKIEGSVTYKAVPSPIDRVRLSLDMSLQEAEVLHVITRKIGGGFGGPRGFTDKIRAKLYGLGIPGYAGGISGNITFPDSWDDFVVEEVV